MWSEVCRAIAKEKKKRKVKKESVRMRIFEKSRVSKICILRKLFSSLYFFYFLGIIVMTG